MLRLIADSLRSFRAGLWPAASVLDLLLQWETEQRPLLPLSIDPHILLYQLSLKVSSFFLEDGRQLV